MTCENSTFNLVRQSSRCSVASRQSVHQLCPCAGPGCGPQTASASSGTVSLPALCTFVWKSSLRAVSFCHEWQYAFALHTQFTTVSSYHHEVFYLFSDCIRKGDRPNLDPAKQRIWCGNSSCCCQLLQVAVDNLSVSSASSLVNICGIVQMMVYKSL